MVKQKVKQLQIGGLSKFTEPNCVFLSPLPMPLTQYPPLPPQLVLSDTDT